MEPVGTLVGFAEVSLGLAGFAAIVLVLATRDDSLDPIIAANVRDLVINGVGCAFASLLGVTLLAIEMPLPFAWILASGLVLLGTLVYAAANLLVFLRRLEAQDPLAALWWSFPVAACAIHLINAAGIFGPASFGLFFLGLFVQLALAGAQFVRLASALIERSAA